MIMSQSYKIDLVLKKTKLVLKFVDSARYLNLDLTTEFLRLELR